MADKKFVGVTSTVDSPEVNEDYAQAKVFDKVKVGKLGVYFKEGLKTRYIPYGYMERVFIRIHEINGRLCCGTSVFSYFRLVFIHGGEEFADVISEDEKAMDAALVYIHDCAPDVSIGVEK